MLETEASPTSKCVDCGADIPDREFVWHRAAHQTAKEPVLKLEDGPSWRELTRRLTNRDALAMMSLERVGRDADQWAEFQTPGHAEATKQLNTIAFYRALSNAYQAGREDEKAAKS